MNSIDVSIYYPKDRVDAMERILKRRGIELKDEIEMQMDKLYWSVVPEQERQAIEEKLEREETRHRAEQEAARRFAVVHLHGAYMDYHFTTELHTTFLQAARLYRVVTKDLKSPLPTAEAMSHAFMSHQPVTPEEFSKLCDSIATDNRITALIEFDFEEGTVGVCQSSDNAWWYYNLKDVSTAAFRADRKQGLSLRARDEIFESHLMGKELDVYQEETMDPSDEPNLRM